MLKYVNYLKYFKDVEKVTLNESEQCIVILGKDGEVSEREYEDTNTMQSLRNITLILSRYKEFKNKDNRIDLDEIVVTFISKDVCRTNIVKGTQELLEFVHVSKMYVESNKVAYGKDIQELMNANLVWFRMFTTEILKIENVKLIEYDEDCMKLILKFFDGSYIQKIRCYGITKDSKPALKCIVDGTMVIAGMREVVIEECQNITEFKNFLRSRL